MNKNIGIIGEKIGMTRIFDPNGVAIPVSIIKAGPAPIIEVKTTDKNGYESLKVAFKETKENRLNKPLLGIFKKLNIKPHKFIREIRVNSTEGFKVGDVLSVDIFKEGEYVDVTGITKAKGFQGAVKRWGFAGGPKTRGQSDRHRAVGSIGSNTFPGRVWKNKKMPGRMGGEKVTIQNLEIVKILKDKNILIVKGSVPGKKGEILIIKKAVKGSEKWKLKF